MPSDRRLVLSFLALLLSAGSLAAQNPAPYDDLAGLVGLRLDALVERFGIPGSVEVARGEEPWQDDVVFTYPQGDFYLHRDRVWQIGLKAAPGMKVGDPEAVAFLIFGVDSSRHEGMLILPLRPPMTSGWPVALRVNLVGGRIAAIFVYRTDF
ncbi:MAG: hypothetical protein FWD94_02410 [Treponema sp.]|nr:hypothetical protein [Treponema sp.]